MARKFAALNALLAAISLAGCAVPLRQSHDYGLQREATAGTHKPVPVTPDVGTQRLDQRLSMSAVSEIQYGTGVFLNTPPTRDTIGSKTVGTITLNFNNQPVQAAVKAILADVLHVNYSIAPSVKGTVTFTTSQPIPESQVLPILQMLLSWTGNALVRQDSRYLVVPIEQAAPGNLVPGLSAVPPGAAYSAQLFPLHYVSAEAMQELLRPFSKSKAFLLVDPLRNLLIMGGTPDQLANYRRIIRTFDVDWLRGMSVAVIPLQQGSAGEMAHQLEAVFDQSGGRATTMAGRIRLIPLRQSNSIVVITSQPAYIADVRELIDNLGNGTRDLSGLYVYDVLNVQASDLAKHLGDMFGNGSGIAQQNSTSALASDFSPTEQTASGTRGTQQGFGSFMAGGVRGSGNSGMGMMSQTSRNTSGAQSGQPGTTTFTTSAGVRIVAAHENNQLLIRASPSQWEELLPVIRRLDQKPLQLQIDTKVLEVDLTGEFQFGVQYYLGGLIGTQPGSPPNTDQSYHRHQAAAGFGGVAYNPVTDALFYSFAGNTLQFALSAMESSGDTKVLSAPSTVVLNNQQTTIKVGTKIPVVQTAIIAGLGNAGTTGSVNATSIQYIDTGVLLDVVPRVSPGGLVYLDIQQVVSNPTSKDQYGNYTIANRALSTEIAVQSGQTVLLGGLIEQSDAVSNTGVPLLSRIPVLGHLFGTTDHRKSRTELIVLITPRVIRDSEDARRVTDEYQIRFQSLQPILPKPH